MIEYEKTSVPMKCPVCEGKGKVPSDFYAIAGKPKSKEITEQCRSCIGTGMVFSFKETPMFIDDTPQQQYPFVPAVPNVPIPPYSPQPPFYPGVQPMTTWPNNGYGPTITYGSMGTNPTGVLGPNDGSAMSLQINGGSVALWPKDFIGHNVDDEVFKIHAENALSAEYFNK